MAQPREKRSFSVVKLGDVHTPAPIEMFITGDEVGITMSLDDFVAALALKVGNPTMLFTQAQLRTKLTLAAADIVAAMKNETVRLV